MADKQPQDAKAKSGDELQLVVFNIGTADIGDTVMGFIVDSVREVIRLQQSSVEPAPSVIANKIGTEYVRGVGKMEDRLLILLDLDKILSANELRNVNT